MPKTSTLSPGGVKLLQEKQIANFITLMPGGAPQVTPVWVDVEEDGSHVLINTAEGRVKTNNLSRDNRVALDVVDAQNPYRFVSLRGEVVERRHEGAEDHINQLSHKYTGRDYPLNPAQQRVILRIRPSHVLERGTGES